MINGASLWLEASATPAKVMETAAATARSLDGWIIGYLPLDLRTKASSSPTGGKADWMQRPRLFHLGVVPARPPAPPTYVPDVMLHLQINPDPHIHPVERRPQSGSYIGAHLLEVILTSVGVFKYFRVEIGTCSSFPVMSTFTLSFQVAPSLNVTSRFMLHR